MCSRPLRPTSRRPCSLPCTTSCCPEPTIRWRRTTPVSSRGLPGRVFLDFGRGHWRGSTSFSPPATFRPMTVGAAPADRARADLAGSPLRRAILPHRRGSERRTQPPLRTSDRIHYGSFWRHRTLRFTGRHSLPCRGGEPPIVGPAPHLRDAVSDIHRSPIHCTDPDLPMSVGCSPASGPTRAAWGGLRRPSNWPSRAHHAVIAASAQTRPCLTCSPACPRVPPPSSSRRGPSPTSPWRTARNSIVLLDAASRQRPIAWLSAEGPGTGGAAVRGRCSPS